MIDTTTSIILSLLLGIGVVGISFLIKNQTRRQFLSIFNLGAVLIVSGITRVIITEGDQLTTIPETVVEGEEGSVTAFFSNPVATTVMTTDQSKPLGTYLTASTAQTELTKDELILFYNTIVLDSEYDWVTLILGDGKGIMFSDATVSFTYGDLDEQHCVLNSLGDGLILGDTVEYQFY